MVEVEVQGISLDLNNTPVLLLRERNGNRVLPIWIGPIEASAITYAVRGEAMERPLTIDLIKRVIQSVEAKVERVVITDLKGNTYFANLMLSHRDRLVSIDVRPSDSVAIAIHTEAPIFVEDDLMDSQGREINEDEQSRLEELRNKLQGTDPEQFGNFKL